MLPLFALFNSLCVFQVERGGPARTRFPDIYREFESLQAQVRQAAQDYIISPQGGAMPLEVRNIEVSRGELSGSTGAACVLV